VEEEAFPLDEPPGSIGKSAGSVGLPEDVEVLRKVVREKDRAANMRRLLPPGWAGWATGRKPLERLRQNGPGGINRLNSSMADRQSSAGISALRAGHGDIDDRQRHMVILIVSSQGSAG
jgi:hypothetical protein